MAIKDTSYTLFALDQDFLRAHMLQFLQEQGLSPETEAGADVRLALEAPRKLLSPTQNTSSSQHIPAGIWALIPLHIARYCDALACPELLSCIALSSECFLCALDLLDDVEDDDMNALRLQLGDARLLNVATVLLALASQSLLMATRYSLSYERLVCLQSVFHQQWLYAARGQHHDLLAERRSLEQSSPEECLCIAEEKAGSLVSLVCSLATLSVGAPAPITDLFASIGSLVGIAHQLDNDINDLTTLLNSTPLTSDHTYKSDLVRSKKTLPIVLASERLAYYQEAQSQWNCCVPRGQPHAQAYNEALKASLAVALYYRSRAAIIVQQIEALSGIPFPPALRFLLSLDGLPLQGADDAHTQ